MGFNTFAFSGFLAILLQSSAVLGAPAPSHGACAAGEVNGAIHALQNQPDANVLEFCSTYLNLPPVTTTIATTYPITTVTTVFPLTTVGTTTPLTTTTVTSTTTVALGPVQMLRKRAMSAVVSAFGPTVVSSACSCLAPSISLKTTSVTATSTLSVTATSLVPVTATAGTATLTSTVFVIETAKPSPGNNCKNQPIISNGDFSSGLNSWTPTTPTQNTCGVQNGIWTATLNKDPNGGAYSACIIAQSLNTCAGKTYNFSVRYFIQQQQPDTYLNGFADHNYILSVRASDPSVVGSWLTSTGSFTAATDGTLLELAPVATNRQTDVIQIDSFVVTEA